MTDVTTVECWMPVLGFEGFYEVSDLGRVRSVDRVITLRDGRVRKFFGQDLILQDDSKGYAQVSLSRNSKLHTRHVHRLVLEAFVGLRPTGMECCHANDVSNDNRLENLRWDYLLLTSRRW